MYLEGANKGDNFKLVMNMIQNLNENQNNNGFCGKIDRLNKSGVSCLIKDGNNIVGFLYLLIEGTEPFMFLDMVILPEYRNKGFGYLALEELLKIYRPKEFILAEVKEDNVACIKMLEKLGSIKIADRYYLLQKARKEEFKKYVENETGFISSMNLYDEFKQKNNNMQKVKKLH